MGGEETERREADRIGKQGIRQPDMGGSAGQDTNQHARRRRDSHADVTPRHRSGDADIRQAVLRRSDTFPCHTVDDYNVGERHGDAAQCRCGTFRERAGAFKRLVNAFPGKHHRKSCVNSQQDSAAERDDADGISVQGKG